MTARFRHEHPGIYDAVETHRDRLYRLITRKAQFMLAFTSRAKCSTALLAFFLFLVANSSKESRKRLVRIIHPSAQPLSVQLILGQRAWSAAMFDEIRSIDLDNLETIGDFATAYIGIALLPTPRGLYL